MHEQSLRSVSPKLYNILISELEKHHIHPYDIQANAVVEEAGFNVIIRFGEGFQKTATHFFKPETKEETQEVKTFMNETAEACKEMLIADYYKMVKTQTI